MTTFINMALAEGYHSNSQRARVITEGWITENMYCPCCGRQSLEHFPNNKPAADFYCPDCGAQFELKSKVGALGRKISDGAYDTMMRRIGENDNPNFLFMSYSLETLSVRELLLVPRFFFVPGIIEKRKPLAPTARRAGWTGCNIFFEGIPAQGRIPIISSETPRVKADVIADYKESERLYTKDLSSRGWLMDVLECVNKMPDDEFDLADIYYFSEILGQKHPGNNNVEAKIRQQLQQLRDRGMIAFLGKGRYLKLRGQRNG